MQSLRRPESRMQTPGLQRRPEFCRARQAMAVSLLLALGGCGGGGGSGGSGAAAATAPTALPEAAPAAAVIGAGTPTNTPVATVPPTGYVLAWSDEFDTPGDQLPDSGKWAYDTARNKLGWFNNEKQYYASSRLENAKVSGGKLIITARKEDLSAAPDWGGQHYTSARLYTRGKVSWTYGFFEIRAKLPCGAGSWPAIWTLGDWNNTWPLQGEIDIMEQTGWDKTTVLGTVHTQAGSGGAGSTGSTTVSDACGAFHRYQITWTPQAIHFAVDGVSYRTAYANPGTGLNAWPFDQPQYLLLNLAIGGDLGGTVNDAQFPMAFEIDYVRIYRKP